MSGGAGWTECYRTYDPKPGPYIKELMASDLQVWRGWLARMLRSFVYQAWALYQRTDSLGSSGLTGLAGQSAKVLCVPSLGPMSKN